MAVRKSVNDSTTDDERAAAVREIRELQNRAFDLLVHERLAADESFRIFITLANDTLAELGAITSNDS